MNRSWGIWPNYYNCIACVNHTQQLRRVQFDPMNLSSNCMCNMFMVSFYFEHTNNSSSIASRVMYTCNWREVTSFNNFMRSILLKQLIYGHSWQWDWVSKGEKEGRRDKLWKEHICLSPGQNQFFIIEVYYRMKYDTHKKKNEFIASH